MSSLLDIEPETRDTHDNNELLSFTDDVLLSNYMDVEEFGENIISEYDNDEFLKIMHFNVDNLTTKFDALSTLVTQQLKGKKDPFFDLIAVSETHLRAEKSVHNACSLSEDEVMLSLDGYGFKGKSRTSTKKGGVGFFVKRELFDQFTIDEQLSVFHDGVFESVFIKSSQSQKQLLIGTIYLPNGLRSNKAQILDILENICENIQRLKCECIIVGDMNIDLMKYLTDDVVSEYIDLIVSNGLKFRLAQPTRVTHTSATLIDHVIDNLNTETKACGVITTQLYGASGYTDHFPVYSIVQRKTRQTRGPSTITRRRFNAANKQTFKDNLQSADFSSAYHNDVNQASANLVTIIQSEYNKSFPLVTQKVKKYDTKDKEFMTAGLLKSCKVRDKMLKNITKNKVSRDSPAFVRFKKYRNLLTGLIRKQKKNHFDQLFLKHKHDIKKTLNLVNGILNKSNDKHSLTSTRFKVNGTMTSDNATIADGFNKFFAEVGPSTNSKVKESKVDANNYLNRRNHDTTNQFSPTEITLSDVIDACETIKKKTSTDHYEMSQDLVLTNLHTLAPPIAHIWNQSIQSGTFPDSAKIAKVVPVYKGKKLDASEFTNYRPISLLPVIGKIIEKIMHKQLTTFLEHNSILFSSQYGFRKNHNTSFATMDFLNTIAHSVDQGELAFGVFIDLSKAFDTINHELLLKKLEHYGIAGIALDWFRSYLSGRSQYVSWNNVTSSTLPIKTGVPQGSVLGPLLFLLYINDLPWASNKLKLVLFADDSNILLQGKDSTELSHTIAAELETIYDWFCANKLLLNASKTKLIIFKSRKCRLSFNHDPVYLDGIEIKQVPNENFLGLQLDDTLKWYEHTQRISNCLSQKIGMLRKVKNFVSKETLKLLYTSFIQPHLSYGIALWGGTFDKGLSRVAKLQKKAIRLITGANRMYHTEPRQKKLGLLKLEDLYKLQVNCFTYDCLKGQAPQNFRSLFEWKRDCGSASTRSHADNPYDIRLRNNNVSSGPVGKASFSHVAPIFWNNLPNDLKTCASKAEFKRRVKKHLLEPYSTVINCNNRLCSDIEYCVFSRDSHPPL